MLKEFTDDQLDKELRSREEIKRREGKPSPKTIINTNPLRKLCYAYINELDEKGYVDDDFECYIFEAAMTTYFGKNVWGWIKKQKE